MKTVIEMAREAAAVHGHTFKTVPSPETIEFITAFDELVRADERARMATDKSKEAIKLALEALGQCRYRSLLVDKIVDPAVTALREALAEQPVLRPCRSPYCECFVGQCSHPGFYDARGEPLPPAHRTWVGLTDEEINNLDEWVQDQPFWRVLAFARAIEAKLRSKNEDRN